MIDLNHLRQHPEIYVKAAADKSKVVDIDAVLKLDVSLREIQKQEQDLRTQRNELAQLGKSDPEKARTAGIRIKTELKSVEERLAACSSQLTPLLLAIPNVPLPDVPVGHSEEENKVVKEWGTKRIFDFSPKTHWQMGETHNLIDKVRAAKVAGSRFAYLKGDLVKLQFAIVQFVMKTLGDEEILKKIISDHDLKISSKAFTPILPPAMIKTAPYSAMDRLEPRDERYQVGMPEDDLWLQGSAEHTMGSMYWNETLPENMFPIRYIGYLTSFRREAGTYGKDMEGIKRMHQFDKLEMEAFSTPETGIDEHRFMIAIQEYFMQALEIPYQLIQKCTFDIGKPNASGWDINAWLPGQNTYCETHTADYMTDYQARRLNTRVKKNEGGIEHVHTNDATAFALGRIMIAIMENYQQEDGTFGIPNVLKPFTW
ncbi:MAG: serine--tRNA ligase [Candidatus Roizmanbacteria bacterium]